MTASSAESPGTLLASARHLEVEHLVEGEAQEEEADEVEAVVADHLDLATTVASLDTSLASALRKDPPKTPVHATTATRPVICQGTAHHHLEVAVVKTHASATNVVRRATCPVNAQTLLHLNDHLTDETSATRVERRIILHVTVHRRAALVVVVQAT